MIRMSPGFYMWKYSRHTEQEGGYGTHQRYIISSFIESGNADITYEKLEYMNREKDVGATLLNLLPPCLVPG